MSLGIKTYEYKCGFKVLYLTINGLQVGGPCFTKHEINALIAWVNKGLAIKDFKLD